MNIYDIKNKKEILLQTIRKDNPNKSIPTVDDLTELGYPKLQDVNVSIIFFIPVYKIKFGKKFIIFSIMSILVNMFVI